MILVVEVMIQAALGGYIYLFGSLTFLALWLVFYWRRKDLRREMWVMSLLTSPLALSDLLFVPEYWRPQTLFDLPVGIEGFLFCFAVGGVAAVLYEVFLQRVVVKSDRRLRKKSRRHRLFFFAGPLIVLLLYLFARWGFIYAALLGMSANALIVVALRRDLFPALAFSGSVFAILYTFLFVFMLKLFPEMLSLWTLQNLWGVFIAGVPIEEVLWAFLTGAAVGSFYEFWRGYRLVDKAQT
jgi:hypothetical protein